MLLFDRGLEYAAELGLEQKGELKVVCRGELVRLDEYELAILDGQVKVAAQIVLTLQLLDQYLDLRVVPADVGAEAVVDQVREGLAERHKADAQILKKQIEHIVHVDCVGLFELDLAQRLRVQMLVVVDEEVDRLVVNAQFDQAVDHTFAGLYHAFEMKYLKTFV